MHTIIFVILHVKVAAILRITFCIIFKLLSTVGLDNYLALFLLFKTNSENLIKLQEAAALA